MRIKTNFRLAGFFALLLASPAAGDAACRDLDFEGTSYTACQVALADDLRLFHSDTQGALLGSFAAVNDALAAEGKTLAFAMNAGMYHPDRAAVGLYIENGTEYAPIVTADGPGNFGLLPNGVFCLGEDLRIVESRAFKAAPPTCRYASQSGPMLVIGGALHPRFLRNSASRYLRNGVGVSEDGQRAVFAISNEAVNFHSFARLFRDGLRMHDALYFDGKISKLYAPELGRQDVGFPMGPIIGIAVPQP